MKNKQKNKKSAMTLAEILIVVTIVAIIGGVFLAMPKKNIGQMDKTKYYIAYNTLYKLLQEQMIQDNHLSLNNNNSESRNFGDSVEKWLNVTQSCDWEDDTCTKIAYDKAENNAILSNGMYLDWRDNDEDVNTDSNITTKIVYVDIDGLDEGRSQELRDVHYFKLYLDTANGNIIRVEPIDTNTDGIPNATGSWIGFKVFQINNNGTTKIILTDVDYPSAYSCYINGSTCSSQCNINDSNRQKCFIEPIRPMK